MNYKNIFFFLSCSIVVLLHSYTIVLAEENNPINDSISSVYLHDLFEQTDHGEEALPLVNYNEDLLMNREFQEFLWENVPCRYDLLSKTLIIGGGEISAEYMLGQNSPFQATGTSYPMVNPSNIEVVVFEEEIKFNGSAEGFFSMIRNCTEMYNLNNIDTTNVTNMSEMFLGVKLFTPIDISSWDTSNVFTMRSMFEDAGSMVFPFDITLPTNPDNSNLTNMEQMFSHTYFSSSSNSGAILQNFDTSHVESMELLFGNAKNIGDLDLSKNSMPNVTNVREMFNRAEITKLILPVEKPQALTNMTRMFLGLQAETITNLEEWETGDVTNMSYLFSTSLVKEPPIQNFDTHAVQDASFMFEENTYEKLDLRSFDTYSLTTIDGMFSGSKIGSLNLSGWKNPQLKSMDSTFSGGADVSNPGYINVLDITDFNTANVKNMDLLFYNANIAEGFDFSTFNVSSVTSMWGTFRASGFEEFDFSTWDTSNVTDMSEMFAGDIGRDKNPVPMKIKKLDLSELNTDSLTDSYRMFANLSDMEYINLESFHSLDSIDTEDMFVNCNSLAKIELGENITSFPKDTSLPEIDSSSKYPTSWLSEKSGLFFETTPEFIAQYQYTINDGSNEVMIRSFKYNVQYMIEDELKIEEEYLYNELVEIPNYFNNRYEISNWVDFESETKYIPYTEVANIGVTKTSFGKTVALKGAYGEREVKLNMHWKTSTTDRLETSMDIGENNLAQSITIRPELEFDHPPTETDKLVSYKVATYDTSNQQRKLIQTTVETFEMNQSTDWLYDLVLDDLPEGTSSIELEFSQLSIMGENEPIKESPTGKLFISLTKDRSFSVVEHPEVLRWDIKQSDSKGILARSEGNDLSFLILNSLHENNQWDIKLAMDFPENTPFKFIWKNTKNDDGRIIDRNDPMLILTKAEAESMSGYKYTKSWTSDTGLLIQSDAILPSNSYGNDVSVTWILSSNPDFK